MRHVSKRQTSLPCFMEVFRQYAPYVWRVLRRFGVTESDVEDVCQEVFVVVNRKLPDFESRSSLRTWIYGICIRVSADYHKRSSRRHEIVTSDLPERSVPQEQFKNLECKRWLTILDRALEAMDQDKRQVFVLYEIEQLTMAEVAKIVDCPLHTAYSRLYASRRQVKEFIQYMGEGRSVA